MPYFKRFIIIFSVVNDPSARKENPLQHCVIQVEDVFMNPCDAQADKSAE